VLLLRMADGVLTTVEVFLNARYGYDVRCEIVSDQGTLALTEPITSMRDGGRWVTVEPPALG
jgi:myo-inositol 2-dehydrogenase/D-chiro-inositol 1-dehydrogenase